MDKIHIAKKLESIIISSYDKVFVNFKFMAVFVLVDRKCECCGDPLGDEDVMKIVLEDGSCEVFPFSRCPKCFAEGLSNTARR